MIGAGLRRPTFRPTLPNPRRRLSKETDGMISTNADLAAEQDNHGAVVSVRTSAAFPTRHRYQECRKHRGSFLASCHTGNANRIVSPVLSIS